ncbi:MAG: class IV adenylate cyclase [Promethearchaeota archaeon]|nr:MAG: class IV adenylate cyclase [Candidatus Lokiarchaeota archaeon]
MPLEVEVKFHLRDKDEYEDNLKKFGAKYITDINHSDTYYKLPVGQRDFAKTDEALRLRRIEEFDARMVETLDPEISADLTYKGPKIDTETKTRKELVTSIGDPDNLELILKSLGIRPILTLEKKRRLYTLDFNTLHIEILIDEIEHLEGYYSECEIICMDEEEMEEGKKTIFGMMEKLGYDKSDSILKSYLELVIKALIEKGELKLEDVA